MSLWIPTHLIIHHSADPDGNGLDFDDYLDFHTRIKLWPDIGYHALNEEVESNVINIYGCPLTKPAIHCPGMNSKALSFCFAGNFSLKPGPSDKRILEAVHRVIIPWIKFYKIPLENIQPHRKYIKTQCPGILFRWAKLIEEIKNGI